MVARALLVLLTALLAAQTGCGSDSCELVVGTRAATKFAVPAEMNRAGCEPGSLAGFDPTGFWYVEEENSLLFSGAGPVRITATCGSLEIAQSSITRTVAPDYAERTDDDLFWRREQTFNGGEVIFVQAYNACRRNSDGTLFGRTVRCFFSSQGEDCTEREFSMQPFGRIEGESEASGLRLVSEFSDPQWPTDAFTANVRVVAGIAYLIRSDALRVIDVSDPSAPIEVGQFARLSEEEGFNDVKIATGPGGKTYAILASDLRGAVVVDVTNPSAPTHVVDFTGNGEGIHTLFTETIGGETRAYLADGFSNAVPIFDITDPSAPTMLGQLLVPDPDAGVHDLFVENGIIYANATTLGFVIADSLATPASPTILGVSPSTPGYNHSNWVTTAGGRRFSVNGDEGYGAHTAIVDVDPASPQFLETIGTFQLRAKVSVHNIMAFGDRAYISHYQDGIRILDLSDPSSPRQIAYFNTWNPDTAPGAKFEGAAGLDVDLAAGLIYVADSPRGLLILEIL